MTRSTIRLTMAQALTRYLCNQFTEIDGARAPLFAGVFAIFGHGNVTCLSEALEAVQDRLPTWRGQNEQSMALAALAFAKAKRRRQLMIATSSIGPGATNMLTAAGLAHTNRLPVLLLAGDVFSSRRPDPVMQQTEHFGDPTVTVNDAFRAVSRYWDRITLPEQIISSLPQAIGTMLDPASCGPAFISLCQDTQEMAFDYPEAFFAPTDWRVPRPRPDRASLEEAAALLRTAKKPLIISGGGVRYSLAEEELARFAEARGVPMAETIAGKGATRHDHPATLGSVGILGTTAANAMAAEADVVVAVGTRLMDFTTGSWTVFNHDARIISINAARYDATKHRALAVTGDALETIAELDAALADWKAPAGWTARIAPLMAEWNTLLDACQKPTNAPTPTYQQVVALVCDAAGERDPIITAAGGLPGELVKGWRVKSPNTFDCEFGYSTMGYEISAGWGYAMARPDVTPIVMVGDGTYLMMNSEIYSSVLTGHKFILIVCDNGGYAVINRLQNAKGTPGFNNLIRDCRVREPFAVDFVAHAESMGALARRCGGLADLKDALDWAKGTDRTTIVSIEVDAFTWTPGDADWDVGVPAVSEREAVREARAAQERIRDKQRVGV